MSSYMEFFNSLEEYVLLNKNHEIATFTLADEELSASMLPLNFTSVQDWLDRRVKFSCARNVREFFNTIGLKTTKDLIEITHCVSLSDTFWVKRKGSELQWEDVSPFRHDYSRVISRYALEGVIGSGGSYFSPVLSTDGSFPHTWKFGSTIKFIKAGTKYTLGGSNSGREPFSEYYACVVAKYLDFDCLEYRIKNHTRSDGRIDVVTECDCFTSETTGSITANDLGLKSYEDVLHYCALLGEKSKQGFLDMLFLDCLLLNVDRHFSNIEFFIDNDTLEVKALSPIFDNNYSFLPRFIEGYDDFNRDDFRARDGRKFEQVYSLVLQQKSYKKELKKLKSLSLSKPKRVEISDRRLAFLNEFLQMQVEYWLQFECEKFS